MTQINNLILCGISDRNPSIVKLIQSADLVICRGNLSKVWLESNKIQPDGIFIYETSQSINQWCDRFLGKLKENTTIAYVTYFSPILVDQVAQQFLHTIESKHVQIISGDDLSCDLKILKYNRISRPLFTMDGSQLEGRHFPPFSTDSNVMIYEPGRRISRDHLVQLLSAIYPLTQHSFVLLSTQTNICWQQINIEDLSEEKYKDIAALYFPATSSNHSLESFQEVIAHLRAPEDGCPWDKKQTHSSLRTYLLEETYEALEALDRNEPPSLKEELGDLLLQILLHAQIAAELNEFTMADVIKGINEKIVYRHPHVFKDWSAENEKQVVQNWESLKNLERKNNGKEEKNGMLDGIPAAFPALAQAQAIQDRAARVGFDWPEIKPVLDKVLEELEEVNTAPNETERAKELGDLLFAIVNLIRWYKVDAESALRFTNSKFRKRFAYIEEQARKTGIEMSKMTLEEMDVFWEEAKAFDD